MRSRGRRRAVARRWPSPARAVRVRRELCRRLWSVICVSRFAAIASACSWVRRPSFTAWLSSDCSSRDERRDQACLRLAGGGVGDLAERLARLQRGLRSLSRETEVARGRRQTVVRAAVTVWASRRPGRVDAGGDVLLRPARSWSACACVSRPLETSAAMCVLAAATSASMSPLGRLAVDRVRDLGQVLPLRSLVMQLGVGEAEVRGGGREVVHARPGRPPRRPCVSGVE